MSENIIMDASHAARTMGETLASPSVNSSSQRIIFYLVQISHDLGYSCKSGFSLQYFQINLSKAVPRLVVSRHNQPLHSLGQVNLIIYCT